MNPKIFIGIAAIAVAVYVVGSLSRFHDENPAYDTAACAGPPLRNVEKREAAMQAGYTINGVYDCIDRASYAEVERQKALWVAAQQERPANVRLDRGASAYHARNYDVALQLLEPLAREGDALAQILMGAMYHEGNGVKKDDAAAYAWNLKAAEQGDPRGQALLGIMHEEGWGARRDAKKAAEWFRRSAEQGYPLAQLALGRMYLNGTGVRRDEAEALGWWRKAAEAGNPDGQTLLGLAYYEGRGGLAKDNAQAKLWLQRAAAQGDRNARSALSHYFKNE